MMVGRCTPCCTWFAFNQVGLELPGSVRFSLKSSPSGTLTGFPMMNCVGMINGDGNFDPGLYSPCIAMRSLAMGEDWKMG